jgi:uncharacterized delta-60 repeat protein
MGVGKSFLLAGLSLMLAVPVFGQGVYEAWVAMYNGPGNSFDYAFALAVDDSGNVYVTGNSWGGGTFHDYATIKYAPNGDTLWVKRYNGPGNSEDEASALAVDNNGNVYVTGNSYYDYATIKYAPNGDTLWVRRYNGPANDYDYGYALAVDDSGNVYVTGYSYGSGTYSDYATIKYAPNGDTLWVRTYNGPGNSYDYAYALAVDDTGNVYVTGTSYGSGTPSDYATIKYAPNGDTLWVRRYNGPENIYDGAYALTVDDSGNVYVTGESEGVGTYRDYATIKYAPDGDTLWVKRYNGPENSYDAAYALAVDDSGNVYVTGESEGVGTFRDYATIKYAPNGDTLWVKRYNGPGNGGDEASDLALDGSGNVYVTGGSYSNVSDYDYATIKYSPCSVLPGDVNSSGTITLGDIVHLLNYLFDRDNPPCIGIDPGNCWDFGLTCRGDVNSSASITLGDVIHLLNYVFDRDKPPCLGTDPGNCWTPVASGACCQTVP